MEAVSFVDFSFRYPQARQSTLENIDLSIGRGAFVVLCGPTGSGKTTLLRCIKHEIAPVGTRRGEVFVLGHPMGASDPRQSAAQVGFVMQDPENQSVMDTVWHELAFGLENLGVPTDIMQRRVAETAHFFGIGEWFEKRTSELSGGQKQILNLAAVMVMQPYILVLDEPTSQLDPIAAKEFLQALERVNRELGTTVILSEHRLEDVLPIADEVVFIEGGKLSFVGTPHDFASELYSSGDSFASALPAPAQVAHAVTADARDADAHDLGSAASAAAIEPDYPLDVRAGRAWLVENVPESIRAGIRHESFVVAPPAIASHEEPILTAKNLWFRYGRNLDFVLRGASVELYPRKIHAVVGGNGSGKSTMLYALSAVRRLERGTVKCAKGKRIALLAQDPKTLFLRDTLLQDLTEDCEKFGYTRDDVDEMLARLGLTELRDRHPYDLSGGEMQKAALAKVLLLSPDILLLDEPTKGVDAFAKHELMDILREQREECRAILVVSHDLDFCAEIADSCSMLFNGEIAANAAGRTFFNDNLFYTTGVNRVTRDLMEGCSTLTDVSDFLREGRHE
ncbi:MAG: ATP-binding cassette domain-containing protein [Coriobacteriia bacterium]|nr:ATP-binding cassette domain-containing protein [Coriobacteriia bacterium]